MTVGYRTSTSYESNQMGHMGQKEVDQFVLGPIINEINVIGWLSA